MNYSPFSNKEFANEFLGFLIQRHGFSWLYAKVGLIRNSWARRRNTRPRSFYPSFFCPKSSRRKVAGEHPWNDNRDN
jgi:hypothetical protein